MNAVKWAFKETASLIGHAIGHAIGPAIFFFLYALVKAFKDNTTIFYFWEHPLELISPALFTILATACVALVRVVIKQHRKLKSFGVRLFSKHDTASVKKSDWAALCLDIELASKERSPLWILGATGKETFSGATAPLFDVLRSYGGDINRTYAKETFYYDYFNAEIV